MDVGCDSRARGNLLCFTSEKCYIFRGTIKYHWDVIAEPEETYCVPKGWLCTKVKIKFYFFTGIFSSFFQIQIFMESIIQGKDKAKF
jgi:hypothetical protein